MKEKPWPNMLVRMRDIGDDDKWQGNIKSKGWLDQGSRQALSRPWFAPLHEPALSILYSTYLHFNQPTILHFSTKRLAQTRLHVYYTIPALERSIQYRSTS